MLKQMIDRIWSGGTSPEDSDIYTLIHNELSKGYMDPGLWTKATAVSDGNTDKAKSRYIEMRANALRQERKKLLEIARIAHLENIRAEKLAIENERRLQEVRQLRAEESRLLEQFWTKYASPEAKKLKRKKNLRNTVIYAFLCASVYFLGPQIEEPGYNGERPIIIILTFFAFLIWLFSLVTYGRDGLKSQITQIRTRIAELS